MKQAWFFLAAIVVFALFVIPGCETDQAVTGIRVQNNIESDITEVKILPAGATVEDFGAATPLNSSPILFGDYRDFETPAGMYAVQVLVPDLRVSLLLYPEVTVVDGQVTTILVELLPM